MLPPSSQSASVIRRPRPFRKALLSGLGVLLPPLLTIVIMVWVWQTLKFYVLEPVTVGTRDILAWELADVRSDLPGGRPTEEKGVSVQDSIEYRRLDQGEYVPLAVYNEVLRGLGNTAPPTSGMDVYRRWVEIRFLRPVIVVPVFLVVFLAAMYTLGSLFAAGVGGAFWEWFEHGITRLPIVRSVYGAAKQVTDYMLTEKDVEFKRVVAFEHPARGMWQLAFVAGEGLSEVRSLAGEPILAVLVPVNPIPISGYIRLIPKREVIDLDMTVDEACHYIISFGVVLPPQQLAAKQLPAVHATDVPPS